MFLDTLDERLDELRMRAAVAQAKNDASTAAVVADAPIASTTLPTVAELKRRYPGAFEPKRELPKGEPGEQLRQAREFSDALRKLRQGDVGEAVGVENGNDKLPPFRVFG